MKEKKEKIRKVFLDDLIKWEYGTYKGKINWKENIGIVIHFIYDGIEGDLILTDVITTFTKKTNLIFYYNDITLNPINTSNFTRCQLGKILGVQTRDFKIEIDTRYQDDKRDITITDMKHVYDKSSGRYIKYYKYNCNKCNFACGEHYYQQEYRKELWVTESDITHGQSCSCCCSTIVVVGINDIPTTTPWMTKYFQGGYDEAKKYNKSSNQSIFPVCSDCGKVRLKKIRIVNIYRNHSIACSCSDSVSYPNKFAYYLLDQLNKIYNFDYLEHEYSPDWIKPKRFDNYFVLNNKEYILEMDGALGHGNEKDLSNRTPKDTLAIDIYKDKLAKQHGIEVIRVDSIISELEHIKQNILNSNLVKIFDLSQIDWLKCEKFALSNLVKVACGYKKNNPNMTTTEIGKIIGCHENTIVRWLKRGAEVGWCKYDANLEKSKSIINNKKLNSMPLICLNTLDIFESTRDCERRCEKILGVKFYASSIGESCRKNGKPSKGFSFKYISDLTDEEKQLYNIA